MLCNECDLTYRVIWDQDDGESPANYCPRCGGGDVEHEAGEIVEEDDECDD